MGSSPLSTSHPVLLGQLWVCQLQPCLEHLGCSSQWLSPKLHSLLKVGLGGGWKRSLLRPPLDMGQKLDCAHSIAWPQHEMIF
jgi:hypothetical protein